MEQLKDWFTGFLLMVLFWYVIFSFVNWTVYAGYWSQPSRIFFSSCIILFGTIFGIIFAKIKKDLRILAEENKPKIKPEYGNSSAWKD